MRTPSPSEVAPARIPKITDLRNQLNYGNARLKRCTAFADDLGVFRRRYSTAGLSGIDIWDWKSSKHQDILRQMTASFLDEQGYGETYWPSDPKSPNANSLQYSNDRSLICRTVRQLIFRLNLQQYRNSKYKNKGHISRPPPIIIDLDAIESTKRPHFPTIEGSTCASNAHSPTDSELNHISYDVYDVPPSPGHDHEDLVKKRRLKAPEEPRPAKQSKMVTLKLPSRTNNIGKRISPRKRKTVQRPECVNSETLDRAIASETDSTSDRDIGDVYHDHPTHIRHESESVERALSHIRTVQPSVTRSFSTSSNGNLWPTPDSRIDPNLERFDLPASTRQNNEQRRMSSTASGFASPKTLQADVQPSIPSSPTTSILFSLHESNEQIPRIPNPPSANLRNNQGQQIPSAASAIPIPVAPMIPRFNIDFNYIVILSRAPIYSYKTWFPRGHFTQKSLSELISELPFDSKADIKGLIIRLEGPGVAIEETLKCGEEAKFNDTKARFLRTGKMCLKTHNKENAGKTLVLNFEIEAVREGVVEEEDDDIDLVF